MTDATVTALCRYPVKGFSPQQLDAVDVRAGEMLPFDRAYAVENGSRDFDPINPKYFAKAKFLQLMSNEQLAVLETRFDDSTATLKIFRNGKQVAAGNLSTPIGRQLIEQFLSAYMGTRARGAPRIVVAEGHHFADVPDNYISLINLASVREIERVVGRPIDPLRFRGNIYVDGWEPWVEKTFVGGGLKIGVTAEFDVSANISRCAATNVDPKSGKRDMQIPRTLNDVFGHQDCGVYLIARSDGAISRGDSVSKTDAAATDVSIGGGLGIC